MIWRYGIVAEGCDYTNLDQWIGKRTMARELPDAPVALREALEEFIREINGQSGRDVSSEGGLGQAS